jgi:hypothetical protein
MWSVVTANRAILQNCCITVKLCAKLEFSNLSMVNHCHLFHVIGGHLLHVCEMTINDNQMLFNDN